MIKTSVLFVVLYAAALMTALALFVAKNDQIDRGVAALKKGDGASALRHLTLPAWSGDKSSQLLVGLIYAYGWGGAPKDDAQAIGWFRRVAPFPSEATREGEKPEAQYELSVAKSYAEGTDGVPKDPIESAKWLKRAAAGGSNEASKMLNARSND